MSGIPEHGHRRHGQRFPALSEIERLLDTLVEEVLAEGAPPAHAKSERTPPVFDPVEAFLTEAAAFLHAHVDATALIERLRPLLSKDDPAPLPSQAEDASARPCAPPDPGGAAQAASPC